MKLFNINIYIYYLDKSTNLRFAYKLHKFFCKEDDIRPFILIMRVKTHTLYSSHWVLRSSWDSHCWRNGN